MVEDGKSVEKSAGPPPDRATAEGRNGQAPAAPSAGTAEPPAGRPTPAAPARQTPAFLWLLIGGLAIVVAGVATIPLWWPRVSQNLAQALDARGVSKIAGLDQRLQAIEAWTKGRATDPAAIQDLEADRARSRDELKAVFARLEAMERTLATVRQMAVATQATSNAAEATQSLQELSDRLARLESAGGKVTNLGKRLEALEKLEPSSPTTTGAQATVLAVSQLREAARGSGPFGKELEALKAIAGGDAQVETLIAALSLHAARGVVKVVTLQDRFPDVATRIARASRARGGTGWVDQTLDRLSSLVTLRRVDQDLDPVTPDALLAAAEAELKDGDLIETVQVLESLRGPPRDAAEPWLKDARARIDVEQVIASLHVYAVSLLGPAKK